MGIAVSLIIAAVGLILAVAVHPTNPGSVDPNTVGWILFIVGLVGLVLDLVLWSAPGPAYLRRRTVVEDRAYAVRRRPVRRTVVEEEDAPGPPPAV
jgi:Domain of unknown function (DUF6458)